MVGMIVNGDEVWVQKVCTVFCYCFLFGGEAAFFGKVFIHLKATFVTIVSIGLPAILQLEFSNPYNLNLIHDVILTALIL